MTKEAQGRPHALFGLVSFFRNTVGIRSKGPRRNGNPLLKGYQFKSQCSSIFNFYKISNICILAFLQESAPWSVLCLLISLRVRLVLPLDLVLIIFSFIGCKGSFSHETPYIPVSQNDTLPKQPRPGTQGRHIHPPHVPLSTQNSFNYKISSL